MPIFLPQSFTEFTQSFTESKSSSVKLRVNSVYLSGKKISLEFFLRLTLSLYNFS